jgi:AraC family transcriptional regulator, melibiose operon regulatory protein
MNIIRSLYLFSRFTRKRISFLLSLLVIALSSCNTSHENVDTKYTSLIQTADSLLNIAPDSAGKILLTIIADSSQAGEINFNKAMLGYSISLTSAGKTDSAIYWAERSLKLAEHRDDTNYIIRNLMHLGNLNSQSLRLSKAIAFYSRGQRMAENANQNDLQIGFLLGMGNVQQTQADYPAAMLSYTRAARIARQYKDVDSEAVSYNNIGQVMVMQKDYKEAIRYTNMAVALDNGKINPLNYAMYLLNIGNYYNDMHHGDSAMLYYNRAETIYQNAGDSMGLIKLIFNRASIDANTGNLPQAKQDLNLVLDFSRRYNSPEGQMYAINALADMEYRKSNYTQALLFTNEAIKIAVGNNMLSQLPDVYTMQYKTLMALEKYKDAVNTLNESKRLSDSIAEISKQSEISAIKIQFDTELKDHEIENLTISLAAKSKAHRLQLIINIMMAMVLIGTVSAYFYINRLLRTRTSAYNALLTIYSLRQSSPQDEHIIPLPGLIENKNIPLAFKHIETNNPGGQPQPIDSEEKNLYKQIKILLDEKQVFLDAQLTLEKFAVKASADKRIISQAVSKYYGLNFKQLINKYRVEFAMNLLDSRENDMLKVEYIGLKSGFNSRPTFYSIFTSYTGLPPAVYRQGMIDQENKG